MQWRRSVWAVAAAAALGCGGSSTGPGGNNGLANDPLSAVINGVQWGSPVPSASYSNQILSIAGTDLGITWTIVFGVRTQAAGTFPFGIVNPGVATATLTSGGKSWTTSAQGASGTLTITTLTSNRVAGTFNLTAVPSGAGATGNVTVTNGKFDVSF